jgi:hypothetical protein
MADSTDSRLTLGETAARQLSNTTKTAPQWSGITPRWLVGLLPWVPVEAGTYRVNKVVDSRKAGDDGVECSPSDATDLPETFVDYDPNPREYTLNAVTTVVDIQTRVSDLFSSPHDQIREQLRLTVERVKERQENELVNNPTYGLLNQAVASQRISTRTGPPTPDDLDELIAKVWKQPSFFLANPRAIAAIGRECTRRGVPPATVNLFGSQFLTWRGLPIVPCDKLAVAEDKKGGGTSNILLIRTGVEKQGVVGLFQPGVPGEVTPSLSVRFMGINRKAIASYLVALYCSAAVHTEDAIGVLENVQVGTYHEYK